MSQKLTLGYWNVRALADPIRFALEYAEADYEQKLYEMGQVNNDNLAPDFDRSQWTEEKFSLGLAFPNLPYILDGDLKMTESTACLKYVCRKYGLMPKSDKVMARAENVESVLDDLKRSFFGQFFVPADIYEETKKAFKEKKFPECMTKMVTFMGENKWLVSNEISYVDFAFHTLLDYAECLNPGCTKEFPRLVKYVEDFKALPAIKRYMLSDRFSTYPITAPVARWGYKKEC